MEDQIEGYPHKLYVHSYQGTLSRKDFYEFWKEISPADKIVLLRYFDAGRSNLKAVPTNVECTHHLMALRMREVVASAK